MHRFTSFFFAKTFPSFFRTSTVMLTFRRVWISVNGVLLITNSNPLVWMWSSSVKRNFILLFAKDHTIGPRFRWVLVVVWDKTFHTESDWLVEENSLAVVGWDVWWRKWWCSCWEKERESGDDNCKKDICKQMRLLLLWSKKVDINCFPIPWRRYTAFTARDTISSCSPSALVSNTATKLESINAIV